MMYNLYFLISLLSLPPPLQKKTRLASLGQLDREEIYQSNLSIFVPCTKKIRKELQEHMMSLM